MAPLDHLSAGRVTVRALRSPSRRLLVPLVLLALIAVFAGATDAAGLTANAADLPMPLPGDTAELPVSAAADRQLVPVDADHPLVAVPDSQVPRAAVAEGTLVVDSGEAGPDGVAAAIAATGASAHVEPLGIDDFVRVTVPPDDLPAVEAALARDDRVEGVEADPLAAAVRHVPTDPRFPEQWGAVRIGMPTAWDVTRGNAQTVVAVLDTGVDGTHPDLGGAVLPGVNAFAPGSPVVDRNGHGTEVAGVLAARESNGIGGAGVCPRCTILPVKVLDDGGLGPVSVIAQGIVAAADRGARVINLSLGAFDGSSALAAAVRHAQSRGALVVAAAGNYGDTALGTVPLYPAAYPGVVSVAGSDPADRVYGWSSRGSWVAVSAPGCSVATTLGGGSATVCGTSTATPFVSGVAALAVARQPSAGQAVLATAITSTVTPIGSDVRHGRLDAPAALGAAAALSGGASPDLWHPWEEVGGTVGPPGAVSWANGRSDVFAVSSDGMLLHRWLSVGAEWQPGGGEWEGLGAPPGRRLVGQPAAVARREGWLNVFARGDDDALWHRWFRRGSGWSAWQRLGGALASSPAAASWGPDHVAVLATGPDRSVWLRSFTGSWSGWSSLGGTVSSAPSVASWGPGRLDVFVRGGGGALYHRYFDGGRWVGGWVSKGGVLAGDGRPDAIAWGHGRLDVFVVGAGGTQVYRKSFQRGLGWSPSSSFQPLGTPADRLLSGTGALSWRPGHLAVTVTDADGTMWSRATP